MTISLGGGRRTHLQTAGQILDLSSDMVNSQVAEWLDRSLKAGWDFLPVDDGGIQAGLTFKSYLLPQSFEQDIGLAQKAYCNYICFFKWFCETDPPIGQVGLTSWSSASAHREGWNYRYGPPNPFSVRMISAGRHPRMTNFVLLFFYSKYDT